MAEDEKTESEAIPEEESEKVAEVKEVEAVKAAPRTERSPNVVFVGNKPPMNYVMAVITAFNMGDGKTVILKARGRAISTAVDVAEITRTRFFKDTKVHSISIGTEAISPREGGNPRNVSTMEITLKQK